MNCDEVVIYIVKVVRPNRICHLDEEIQLLGGFVLCVMHRAFLCETPRFECVMHRAYLIMAYEKCVMHRVTEVGASTLTERLGHSLLSLLLSRKSGERFS